MTTEKMRECLDLQRKIMSLQSRAHCEVEKDEPYFDEIIKLVEKKRQEYIEQLKKQFADL